MRGQFKSILILFILLLSTNIFAQVQNEKKAAGELSYEMGRYISMLESASNLSEENNFFQFDGKVSSMEYERLAKLKYLEKLQYFESKRVALSPSVRKKVDRKMETLKSFQTAFEQFAVFQFENQPKENIELCSILMLVTDKNEVLSRCK